MQHKPLLGAVLAATLMGFGAAAQAQFTAIVSTAPPPARYEVIPAPRTGWVWAPGHYEVRGEEYVWIEGQWMRGRTGYEYREPRWVQRGDGSWIMVGGNWERRSRFDDDDDEFVSRYDRRGRFGPNGDLDGDGIPNRRDRDRDGDGVRNAQDDFPNNPRRS